MGDVGFINCFFIDGFRWNTFNAAKLEVFLKRKKNCPIFFVKKGAILSLGGVFGDFWVAFVQSAVALEEETSA